MSRHLLWGLARRNLLAHRQWEAPFVMASSLMVALFYIVLSLINNPYITREHPDLKSLLNLGIILVGLFTIVFILYANRLAIKTRSSEFALYQVMGLEQGHMIKLLGLETLLKFGLTSLFGLIGGHLFGVLIFMSLKHLIHAQAMSMGDYQWSWTVFAYALAFVAITFLLLFLLNAWRIWRVNPMELMRQAKAGQAPPRHRWLVLVLGLALLAYGYYLALFTEGNLQSVLIFLLAAILVMLASYLLFESLSVFVLHTLKRKKSYYYRAENFFSLSGMLYRIRANAMGLASVCIMLTGLIITLGTTVTVYRNVDQTIDANSPKDYMVEGVQLPIDLTEAELDQQVEQLKQDVQEIHQELGQSVQPLAYFQSLLLVLDEEGRLTPAGGVSINDSNLRLIYLEESKHFNARTGENYQPADNELLFYSDSPAAKKLTQLSIDQTNYQLVPIQSQLPKNIAFESYLLVVKDYSSLQEISQQLGSKEFPQEYKVNLGWDNIDGDETYRQTVEDALRAKGYSIRINSKSSLRADLYSMYGGLVFIGILVSIVFLIGTILVTYYKQLSEGQEDQGNYRILRQVGLDETLIQKVLKKQIIWLFFLPLLVACLHTLVASKLVSRLLMTIGIYDYQFFLISLLLTVLAIVFIYYVVYKLTSRVYYHLVR